MTRRANILALSGGIGGAKLALGLYQALKPGELTVLCNTGDDFEHLGFSICPDIDTVIYTLAGLSNTETGWGRAGESWHFMESLKALGGEDWFQLGDKDLATHVYRTGRLKSGDSLSAVCEAMTRQFNVQARVLPATDDLLRTMVITEAGVMPFQHYFVRDQCAPVVTGFDFDGALTAQPVAGLIDLLSGNDLDAIIVCPSNPYISIDPILAVPTIREALKSTDVPVIAVSPIIGSAAVKGPTAKMMTELDLPVSSRTVAEHYGDFLDAIVVDEVDANDVSSWSLTMRVSVTKTMMRNNADKIKLARHVLSLASEF